MPVSEDREKEITQSLKRCSEETVAAALRFEDTKNLNELDAIILGVLARDAANPRPDGMATVTDDMKLIDDIGMDSFGMIEVVMTAEEVLGLTIATEELSGIVSLGDLKQFLRTKFGARDS